MIDLQGNNMSYNPTFPVEFYNPNRHLLKIVVFGGILDFVFIWGFLLSNRNDDLGITIMAMTSIALFSFLTLFAIKKLFFPKPILIINRYYLTYTSFGKHHNIRYTKIKSLTIFSILNQNIPSEPFYFARIIDKNGEQLEIPLPNLEYQGTPYNGKEIYHLIMQAYKGEKLSYQGFVDDHESPNFKGKENA